MKEVKRYTGVVRRDENGCAHVAYKIRQKGEVVKAEDHDAIVGEMKSELDRLKQENDELNRLNIQITEQRIRFANTIAQLKQNQAKLIEAVTLFTEYKEVYGDKPFYPVPHVKIKIACETMKEVCGE